MIKIKSLIILILSYSICSFGQVSEQQLRIISDSIIFNNFDAEYFSQIQYRDIHRSDGRIYFTDTMKEKWEKIGDYSNFVCDTISYAVSYLIGHSNISLTTERGWHPPIAPLHFMENKGLFIIYEPDYLVFQRYLSITSNIETISSDTAIITAFKYLPEGSRYSKRCQLSYYAQDDRVYWLVFFQKGFRNVTRYEALIDAQNGNYIRTEESTRYRTFFKTLVDIYRGSF